MYDPDDAPIQRAECDSCDWVLPREDVLDRLTDLGVMDPSEERIYRKFSSLREGHAFMNRGHVPYYVREDEISEDND